MILRIIELKLPAAVFNQNGVILLFEKQTQPFEPLNSYRLNKKMNFACTSLIIKPSSIIIVTHTIKLVGCVLLLDALKSDRLVKLLKEIAFHVALCFMFNSKYVYVRKCRPENTVYVKQVDVILLY